MMIIFTYKGREVRFRASLVKNYKDDCFDVLLTCVNEPPCPEYDGKLIPFKKYREAFEKDKIKVILNETL
jgi:hypothetical protein